MLIVILKNRNDKSKVSTLDNIVTVSEVKIGEKAWIDSLKKINIIGTNDYFEITKDVKWKIPDYEGALTVSFAIQVPYTFMVDGILYEGIYELGDSERNIKNEKLKYDIKILDLTDQGEIEVRVTK